jgi:hypothetical protein
MYTFNLGFVFGNGEIVSIIVCNSENPIDKELVGMVATRYFQLGVSAKRNVREVYGMVIDGVKRECGVNAILVNADVSCVIPKN